MDITRAGEILDYWIPKDGSADYDKWFMKSHEYDEEITKKFGDLLKEAELGNGFNWLITKDSFVAYIILMDQFSRHIYRGDEDSFKNDNGAMIFTDLGFNLYREQLVGYEFMFAYMPYMHTENYEYQKKGRSYFNKHMELYKIDTFNPQERKITDPDVIPHMIKFEPTRFDREFNMLKSMETHIKGHLQTILSYGRFPKRNKALGRETTIQEEQYMNRKEVKNRPY
jgi:uncharacterized protein (DUF924 family)